MVSGKSIMVEVTGIALPSSAARRRWGARSGRRFHLQSAAVSRAICRARRRAAETGTAGSRYRYMPLQRTLFGSEGSGWQVVAALLVLAGAVVTVGYTVVENFWG
jgi:hypothetical protein